jgi:fatty acid synthase subunit alpha
MINNTLFVAKDKSPYTDEQLSSVLLNPDARVAEDKKTGQLTFPDNFMKLSEQTQTRSTPHSQASLESVLGRQARELESMSTRVGFDVEDISTINVDNDAFLERNFTEAEAKYCLASSTGRSPQKSFAGRWSAKEAVFKALGVPSQGAGAAMKDIEILTDKNGAPTVTVCFLSLEIKCE